MKEYLFLDIQKESNEELKSGNEQRCFHAEKEIEKHWSGLRNGIFFQKPKSQNNSQKMKIWLRL